MVAMLLCGTIDISLKDSIKPELADTLSAMLAISYREGCVSRIPEFSYKDIFKSQAEPLPTSYNDNKTLIECIDIEANRLLELSKSKHIVISWSGGIDSTVIVAALLKNGFNNILHRISVYLTSESITESNIFFFKYILPKFNLITATYEEIFKDSNCYLVTGDPGDQLFGCGVYLKLKQKLNINNHDLSIDLCKDLLIQAFGREGLVFWEHFSEIINYAPFQIKTVEQFWWWWNFTQKWNFTTNKLLLLTKGNVTAKNIINFFSSENFQKWSIHNAAVNRIMYSSTEHKMEAKLYVVDYTLDKTFLSKVKLPSLGASGTLQYHKRAINTNLLAVNPTLYINEYWKR